MAANPSQSTALPSEIAHFQAMADEWWDTRGKFKPLHQINPPRLAFAVECLAAHFGRDATAPRPFAGLTLLDVGCGGGLLAEPLTRLGFQVTGIDAGDKNIAVARLHAEESGLEIDYRVAKPEDIDQSFDVVLAMEVIEHVADPDAFVRALADRLRPGGAFVGATLNRTTQSLLLAIIGAEYVLRWLPRGTHNWKKFLRPSEFAALLRQHGIAPSKFEGQRYDLLHDRWLRCPSLDVNYLLFGARG